MQWKLLEVLSEKERQALLVNSRRRQFAKGEPIFHEGDPGNVLHLVSGGHVAVRVSTERGDQCILRIIGPGGWFGELAMLSPGDRAATILALDRVTTIAIPRHEIDQVRQRAPEFDLALIEGLVGEVRRLSAALLEAYHLPAERRVLRRLADLAAVYGDGRPPVDLPLRQEEIAEIAGTTRPTVNKVLQRAVADGYVALRRGQVTVLDLTRLQRHAR